MVRLLAVPLVLLSPLAARADSGDGAGLGPVIGVTGNGSLSLGWELSGGRFPLLRFAAGGSYQVIRGEGDLKHYHYVAWEPWLYAGGTLGAALTDERDVRFCYGLWEGLADDLGDPFWQGGLDFLDDDTRYHWVLSLSIGWRGTAGTQLFYFTPKIWRMQGYDFFT